MNKLAVLIGAWLVFLTVPFTIARLQTTPRWRARLGFIALVGMVASTSVLLAAVLMPEVLILSSVGQIWSMCSAAFHAIGMHPAARVPSILAGAVLGVLLGRFWWNLVQGIRVTKRARIRELEPIAKLKWGQGVYVLALDQLEAYSVGSVRGQIIMSRGLLAALDEEEQRAVLLHEEGHLRAWHQPMLLVARAAAAALHPLPSAGRAMSVMEQAVEESADEYAAERLGRPSLVARSISKAALAGLQGSVGGAVALGAGPDVPARVQRLLHPPKVARWMPAACAGLALTLIGLIGLTQLLAGIAVLAAAHHVFGLGMATFCPMRNPGASAGSR